MNSLSESNRVLAERVDVCYVEEKKVKGKIDNYHPLLYRIERILLLHAIICWS